MEPNPDEVGTVQGDDTPGPNPAWNDVLSVIPEEFHSVVTPHFQQWDSSAQQRIESANAAVKDFEPYKPFVEHSITPDEIEQGLRLMYEINNNPQSVYEALSKAYNFNQNSGTAPNAEENTPEIQDDPRFNQLNDHLEVVSKIVLADAQAKQDAQNDLELERELSSLKEQHGEYDERYVLALMQNGMSGEDAVKSFVALKDSLGPKPFAPSILGGNNGGGSGIPSNAIDPTKLSGKETRNLVAEMLARANQQG